MPPELTAALALCRNLPSPPGIALRIIELAQDPEADIATAADIIAIDMALSARMLRIANSPLYASRRRIENLGQALTMLGLNATISLALGFTVTQGLTGGTGADHDLRQRAWKRSILSALAASQLGQARGLRRLEELMLAGLLQDLGVLCLAQAESERYLPLLREAVARTKASTRAWAAYAAEQDEPNPVVPLLVVQVADKPSDEHLSRILDVIHQEWPELRPQDIAHVFGTHTDRHLPGQIVNYIAPQRVQETTHIRVLLAMEAISTGWDCPRAEVLMSFRTYKDATYVHQLLGRMVRTPGPAAVAEPTMRPPVELGSKDRPAGTP